MSFPQYVPPPSINAGYIMGNAYGVRRRSGVLRAWNRQCLPFMQQGLNFPNVSPGVLSAIASRKLKALKVTYSADTSGHMPEYADSHNVIQYLTIGGTSKAQCQIKFDTKGLNYEAANYGMNSCGTLDCTIPMAYGAQPGIGTVLPEPAFIILGGGAGPTYHVQGDGSGKNWDELSYSTFEPPWNGTFLPYPMHSPSECCYVDGVSAHIGLFQDHDQTYRLVGLIVASCQGGGWYLPQGAGTGTFYYTDSGANNEQYYELPLFLSDPGSNSTSNIAGYHTIVSKEEDGPMILGVQWKQRSFTTYFKGKIYINAQQCDEWWRADNPSLTVEEVWK